MSIALCSGAYSDMALSLLSKRQFRILQDGYQQRFLAETRIDREKIERVLKELEKRVRSIEDS